MGMELTFKVDEFFDENDLKQVVSWSETACALDNIVTHIQRMNLGKIHHPESADELLEELVRFIGTEIADLPELL